MMQTVQDFDDRGPGHAPKRTVSRFVSDAFSFLDKENDDLDNVQAGYNGVTCSRSEPTLVRHNAVANGNLVKNGIIEEEFTIVTTVENSPVKKDSKSAFNEIGSLERIQQIDSNSEQYTIVTYTEDDDETKLKSLNLPLKFNSVYIADEDANDDQGETISVETTLQATGQKTLSGDTQKEDSSRNSVLVEGDEVELRNSPRSHGERKSREQTWVKNQAVVSEAFSFLRELDDIDNLDIENKSEDCENLMSVDRSITNGIDNEPEGETTENVEDLSRTSNENSDPNTQSLTEPETDDIGELVGGKIRQRKKPKSENADDDGDSSDEDTGVYRESFRKSTWLYIGDNENLKVASSKDYVPLADIGVETCEQDSVFGDGPPQTPKTPLSGHRRNDSTATTVSEADFQKRYNSVRKRFVKRADSQQEYKRFTAQCYDQVKVYHIQKDADQDYGIHLLDSKPAIVSGVDACSPAELAGVKEGQIVTSVNGENVLEMDHDDIIRLVQQNATELRLEVGTGDVSHVIDLQRPVVTGYLQKQTSSTLFRVWKKRFFILRQDHCLYYYKNNQEQDPLGAIPLNGYRVSRYGDHNKFGFKAEKYGCRTFYFLAENKDDMTRWVVALNEAADRGNEKKDAWMDVTTQNVGLPALEIRNPDCSGYLFKQGRATKRWRKRYCVLKDACIYHYKNSNSKEAEGVAHLHGYTVNEKGLPGKRFSFCLNPPEEPMRMFCFCTDNETDRERWVKALHTSIGKWVRVDP